MIANERISIRTTPQAKSVIEQACQMAGVSMNSFIMDNAYQKALALLERERSIKLTADEWDRALEILDNPPEPNKKMQALFERGYKNID